MRTQQPVVTADEVNRTLGTFGRPAMSGPVTIVLGGQRIVAPPRLFGRAVSVRVQDGHLVPQVDADVLMQALAPVAATVGAEPEDARIALKGGIPVVVPARVGVAADHDALEHGFAQALVRRGAARRVVVPGHVRQPSFTTADAQRLGVRRMVSTFTATFPFAAYRNANLVRAAHLVDGTLLRPGETFSLNSALGARTRANGFTDGYVVADGVSGEGRRRRGRTARHGHVQRDVLRRAPGRRAHRRRCPLRGHARRARDHRRLALGRPAVHATTRRTACSWGSACSRRPLGTAGR